MYCPIHPWAGYVIDQTTLNGLLGSLTLLLVAVATALQQWNTRRAAQAAADARLAAHRAASGSLQTRREIRANSASLSVIHSLMNGGMANMMRLWAVAARRVAEMTRHPADMAEAEHAELMLEQQQALLTERDALEAEPAEDTPPEPRGQP